jgi:cytoskeletal protein CcmA (bactofilin family)
LRAVVRLAIVTFASLVSGALLAGPALAQGSTHQLNPRDQIVLNGELTVAEGETVDTAVLGHGTATIDGTVTGAVVVFDGRTDIAGTVHGDVFVFNGAVTVRSGAVIDGDLVTRQIPTVESGATIRGQQQRVSTRFNTGDLGLASRVIWWIGYSVSTLVLGLLLLLLAPALDPAIGRASRERVGGAIGFGVAVFFLLPVVAVLFLVVVVAIPLGLFLLLGLALLYTVGYVAGAHALGRRLVKPPTSRFAAFLAGWAILRVFGFIPLVGSIVWTLASIFGLGVLWVAARRSSPAPVPEPPAMTPPTPTPA